MNMKKQLLFGMALAVSAVLGGELYAQAAVPVDPAVYTRRGVNNEMQLTSKWLYSNRLNNYLAADLLGTAGTVRGMAVKNGKMLFASRSSGNKILVVNGTTGARETPITLASNVFTYLGRNKANTADSTYLTGLPCNDIQVDNASNVLVSNMITSTTGRFQIWKIDVATGAGTLVIDQADLATLFPKAQSTDADLRIDAFGVYGDVNNNAIIMAVASENQSKCLMQAFKWKITAGVAGVPQMIELDNSNATGKDLANVSNLGTSNRVLPVDDTYFYVDGNATYPVLCDSEGNVVDGFKATLPNSIKDSVTAPAATPKTTWSMNQGHNGLAEFEVNGKYFIVMAASNTAGTPASTFRLFQFADANKAFSGLKCLWTFPQAGMGTASNSYRTAMPAVEVSGTKANIYVYTGENGYGMYELETAAPAPNAVINPNNSRVEINVVNNNIYFSEMVAKASVYTIAGQKVVSAKHVASLPSKLAKGVYMVSITDVTGNCKVQKIAVN